MLTSLRTTVALLALVVAGSASATTITEVSQIAAQAVLSNGAENAGLVFHQGDQASYNLDISSFMKGTMSMTVKSVAADAVVIDQDMAIMGQNQSCEETINPNNGTISKMVCNGQAQNPGDNSQIEVVDSKEASVTVPAGTFDTLWIKAHNKKDNTDIQQWINPKLIPVMGLVKMQAPTQMGEMNVELTSFKKN